MTNSKSNAFRNASMALTVMMLLCVGMASFSCMSLTYSKKFSLDMEAPEGQKARLMAAPVTFAENTRIVDITGGRKVASEGGFGGIGSFNQDDARTLGESMQTIIDSVQSVALETQLSKWHIYTVVRSSMETFNARNGFRKTVRCVAWCIADEQNKVLYHEQFFMYAHNRLFQPVGDYKTSTNKIVARRIIRRALQLTTNPDSVDFLENEDPDTYDDFFALREKLPELEVWQNVKYAGTSYTPGGRYHVYRVSGRDPGWETTNSQDDIDWKSYIADQGSTEGRQ